jgi:hypothetical protein
VYNQSPRRGSGDGTKQGIYFFTADGKLLNFRNSQDAGVMREEVRKALRNWEKLPAAKRKPGAVEVGDRGNIDTRFTREPQKGGAIVRTYTRILDRNDDGYCKGTCKVSSHTWPARDQLWLTAAEVKALIPADPKAGDSVKLPKALAMRIARFHLMDNTRGEPPHWERDQIHSLKLTLKVEEVTPSKLKLKLEGSALLATSADVKKAERGYDVQLLGWVEADRVKKVLTRFDAVAVGEHWGEGRFTGGARPGRTPLGVAFELADGKQEADKIPPQGARFLKGYYRADE